MWGFFLFHNFSFLSYKIPLTNVKGSTEEKLRKMLEPTGLYQLQKS